MKVLAQKGFTLIESMIYVLLSCLFIMFTTIFLSESWYAAHEAHTSLVTALHQWEVYHLMCQDCAAADPRITYWDFSGNEDLVMRTQVSDIGWECKKNTLFRVVGKYNFTSHFWIVKDATPVLEKVSNLMFVCKEVESCRVLACSYMHAGKKEEYVCSMPEEIYE